MKKFTLDTNCIIDLEEGNRSNTPHIQKIVDVWKDGRIELAVVDVSASENQKSGTANRQFSAFTQKLDVVGLTGVQHLPPLTRYDLSYWNHGLWSTPEGEKLHSEISGILFPNTQVAPPKNREKNSAWRRQQCDILIAWSHAFHKWDYLVTGDSDFHNPKHDLKKFSIEIVYPRDAAALLACEIR